MPKVEIDEGVKEEILSCINTKKNIGKCVDKILTDHSIPLEEKDDILYQIIKNGAAPEGGEPVGGKTSH